MGPPGHVGLDLSNGRVDLGFGDRMAFGVAKPERLFSGRSMGRSDRAALVLGAIALALGAAAWITDSGQAVTFASAALPSASDQPTFSERFRAVSLRGLDRDQAPRQSLDRPALASLEGRLWDAKALLAQQLMYGDWRAAAVDDFRTSASADEAKSQTSGIPLPRPRPVLASAEPQAIISAVAETETASRKDNRTLFEKLSDLMPGGVKLASLSPDGGGLLRPRVDLAALGYDNQTAVYDISARAVYLPNGAVLEAHSGMGSLRDDPGHVDRRMLGATPPATYELKPREKLFHGVAALRMIPADGNTIFGRSGLLAHSFMLGPEGDSNGCVSIRNYDRFLKAYNDGTFNRLVVVPSLSSTISAAPRATSQS